jgi:NADH-quinone oxidoreductase subunit H
MEADSEIVAGYNIEYSGMKFAMFFLGEWIHAFTICALTAVLFFGGWLGPFVSEVPALGILYFFIKMFVIYFVHIWIRTTMPRLRIDHLLDFNWKFLVPLALANLIVMSLVERLLNPLEATPVNPVVQGVVFFAVNLAMAAVTVLILGSVARRARQSEEARRLRTAVTGVQG